MLLALALLAVPAAQAGHGGEILFLAEGDAPVGDGALSREVPEGEEPSLRPVLLGEAGEARFLVPEGERPAWIQGRLFAGLWIDQPPALPGELEVVLLRLDGEAPEELASTSLPVGGQFPEAPDPATLLPPDPTDPEAVAWHALAQAYPLVRSPPIVADFGIVSLPVEDADLAVAFRLADGSLAPAVMIEYGAALAPSFLYVPWHEPAPAPAPSATSASPSASATVRPPGPTVGRTGPPQDPAGPTDEGSQDTPSPGFSVALSVLGVAAWAARRRRG